MLQLLNILLIKISGVSYYGTSQCDVNAIVMSMCSHFVGTIYYEIVPKNALEMVLWLESDRMGWLLSTVTQEAFENQ